MHDDESQIMFNNKKSLSFRVCRRRAPGNLRTGLSLRLTRSPGPAAAAQAPAAHWQLSRTSHGRGVPA